MDAEREHPAGTVTLWDAPASRWWPAAPVLYAVGGVSLTVLLAQMTRLNPWSLLALLVVSVGLPAVRQARTRVRLTPDGVEVRGVRTTVLRYTDIASVEVAPEWDGAEAVWVRLSGSWPSADPEVLMPPPEWGRGAGRAMADVAALIQARVDAARGPGQTPGDPS